jgi:radical SAM protein with 4Fe4S-binding SPASM domain
MKEKALGEFISESLTNLQRRIPQSGLFELTYRCNLDCVHCYCKGSEKLGKELSADEIRGILDQLHKEGCLGVTFSGGEPLAREDFWEIYLYAKRKGFLIDIFTNGTLLTEKKQKFLQKYPPRSIEITLNGITKEIYEAITKVGGSFDKVMANIKGIVSRDLPLVIKANCLKQNKAQIAKIKAFSKKLLGRDKKRFKFDPYIYPRLNRDRTPSKYRLSHFELKEVIESDTEIYAEYKERLKSEHNLARDKEFLYQCSSWLTHFFINPFGRLKFCQFTENFSIDLRKEPFRQGFYNTFPMLMEERFKTNSKCKDCRLRMFCCYCPARAYLETGNQEASVPYYCELAQETFRQINKAHVAGYGALLLM